MHEIEWTSDLGTGIPVIDKQHRRRVEYMALLDHACTHHGRGEVSYVPVVSAQMARLEQRDQGGWMRNQLKRWFR